MGAKQSEAMTAALDWIINKGKTAAWAANRVGITKGAISKNAQYRAHRDAKKGSKENVAKT